MSEIKNRIMCSGVLVPVVVLVLVLLVSGCTFCFNDVCGEDFVKLEREICEKNGGVYDEDKSLLFGHNGYCDFFEGDVMINRCGFRHNKERGA